MSNKATVPYTKANFSIVLGMDAWVPRYWFMCATVPHSDLNVLLHRANFRQIFKKLCTSMFHCSSKSSLFPGVTFLLKLLNPGPLGMLLLGSTTMVFKPFEAEGEAVALTLRTVSTLDCGGGTYYWFCGRSGGSINLTSSNSKICVSCLAIAISHLIFTGLPSHEAKATIQLHTVVTSTSSAKTTINVPLLIHEFLMVLFR